MDLKVLLRSSVEAIQHNVNSMCSINRSLIIIKSMIHLNTPPLYQDQSPLRATAAHLIPEPISLLSSLLNPFNSGSFSQNRFANGSKRHTLKTLWAQLSHHASTSHLHGQGADMWDFFPESRRKDCSWQSSASLKESEIMGISWWSSGHASILLMQGAQVQSLVRELRSNISTHWCGHKEEKEEFEITTALKQQPKHPWAPCFYSPRERTDTCWHQPVPFLLTSSAQLLSSLGLRLDMEGGMEARWQAHKPI